MAFLTPSSVGEGKSVGTGNSWANRRGTEGKPTEMEFLDGWGPPQRSVEVYSKWLISMVD